MIFFKTLVLLSLFGASFAGSDANCEPLTSDVINILLKLQDILRAKKDLYIDLFCDDSYARFYPEGFIDLAKLDWSYYPQFIANITAQLSNQTSQSILEVILGDVRYPDAPLDCIVDELRAIGKLIEETREDTIDAIEKVEKAEKDFSGWDCTQVLEALKDVNENDFRKIVQDFIQFDAYLATTFIDFAPSVVDLLEEFLGNSDIVQLHMKLMADYLNLPFTTFMEILTKSSDSDFSCLEPGIQEQLEILFDGIRQKLENARKLAREEECCEDCEEEKKEKAEKNEL